jgi:LacI family transcriptional regulator, galactose operon repressor
MTTLNKIATEAGVSITVTSRALSPVPKLNMRVAAKTRDHVLAVAQKLGYRPNRNAEFLKRGMNPVIGCFLPSRPDSLLAKLMQGISEEADLQGFPISFHFDMTVESYTDFINKAKSSKNCGIITYPYFKLDHKIEQVVDEYRKVGGSIVLIESVSSQWRWHDCVSVSIDNYHGGKLAAKHLLNKGVSRFFATNYSNIPERIDGFTDAIVSDSKSVDILDAEDISGIVSKIKKHLAAFPGEKTGIFVSREPTAITLLCQLLAEGIKVGTDLMLISFDGLYTSEFSKPSLTTVAQPFKKVGALAVRKLVADIYNADVKSELVKPELIIRKSA